MDSGGAPYADWIGRDRASGRLYVDERVFRDELERIFHRGWVFVGHASEVAVPGEFATRRLGLQPVLMTRDADGELHLFANRCPHRGSTVCARERGRARQFRCPYHGWTFDLRGALVGLPHPAGYPADFAREAHGLAPVPRVDQYRGFVFGSWAAKGPSLRQHLGRGRELIDRLCELSPKGELEVRCGWLRHRVEANWKIIAENVCDFYHPPLTHAAALSPTPFRDESGAVNRDLGGGHGEVDGRRPPRGKAPSLDELDGVDREYVERLAERCGVAAALELRRAGPPHGLVFPNLFIAGQNLFAMYPTHPGRTCHAQTPVFYAGAPEAFNRRQLRRFEGASGAAGMLETDDSAVWERLQRGLQAGQPEWVLLQRGLDREREVDGAREGRTLDETAARGFWRHYLQVMTEVSQTS